jgi:hypothetical protein
MDHFMALLMLLFSCISSYLEGTTIEINENQFHVDHISPSEVAMFSIHLSTVCH